MGKQRTNPEPMLECDEPKQHGAEIPRRSMPKLVSKELGRTVEERARPRPRLPLLIATPESLRSWKNKKPTYHIEYEDPEESYARPSDAVSPDASSIKSPSWCREIEPTKICIKRILRMNPGTEITCRPIPKLVSEELHPHLPLLIAIRHCLTRCFNDSIALLVRAIEGMRARGGD